MTGYKRGFRYPAGVIQHAVRLYRGFSLSLREVETVLAARGIVVSYETIGGCIMREATGRFGGAAPQRCRRLLSGCSHLAIPRRISA